MSRDLLLVSLGRNGGLPKYAAAIAAALAEQGRPARCLCATGSEHPIPGALRVPTYRDMATLLLSSATVLPLLLLAMAWWRLAGGMRVVYFPYAHTWTPVMSAWARLMGCRAVVTFHDYRPHLGEADRLTRFVLWLTSRLASHFVFLSAHVRDQAVADQPRIAGVSLVAPHGLFSLPGLVEKAPATLREAPRTLLFTGRLSRYKGIEMLAEAFGQAGLPGCRLVIAGKSNYPIDTRGFPPGVELIDRFLDEAEMAALLNEADVLVLPYLEATQSGIVTLGIDSATPMVCTRVDGLREQLGEDEALFCAPEPTALAAALRAAAAPAVRRRLCAALAGRKRAMDWRRIAADIHAFCRG